MPHCNGRSWLKQPHKYSILCKHALPLLFIDSSIISRGQRMHYKYSGHQRRVIQTFGVGNNIERTYTGCTRRENAVQKEQTHHNTWALSSTHLNTHSNNVRIGYEYAIFTRDRVSERFVMLTLMLQNILIALCMIFATELIITKQFPYTGSFVSDMNRTIPIKEVIQSLLSSSLFIKYINWCMCFLEAIYHHFNMLSSKPLSCSPKGRAV